MMTTSPQRSGAVLLAAAAVVGVIGFVVDAGYANIAGFFHLPLLSGLGFLAAAVVGGRRAGLWPTALTTTIWGALIAAQFNGLLPFSDGSPGDARSIAIYFASAVVAGALALLLIRRLGLAGGLRSVAIVVAASAAIYAMALLGVPGVVGWWLYPALMIAMAVALLRPRERVPA